MDSVSIDTNVLAYAEGVERVAADAAKVVASRLLMRGLLERRTRPVIPVQALAELHNVLVTRRRLTPAAASMVVEAWMERADIVPNDAVTMRVALALAAEHSLQIFDAIILATAVAARCDLLLSEDMQDGFAWRGVVVTNPFGASPDPRVKRLLAGV